MDADLDIEELFELYLDSFRQIRDENIKCIDNLAQHNPELANFVKAMMHFIGERSQAISGLFQWDKPWDCEIIYRSILEAATKILFVCTAEDEEVILLLSEFWHDTSLLEKYNKSNRSKLPKEMTNDDKSKKIFGADSLTSEEESEYLNQWNRKKRKALAHKWSFSEMIKSIAQHDKSKLNLESIKILSYCYDSSSHFVHADYTALLLIKDRNQRSEEEFYLLENARYARLFGDILTLLTILYKVIGHKFNTLENESYIDQTVDDFLKKSKKYFDIFYESQKNLYE